MNFNELQTRNYIAKFLCIPVHKLTYILYKKGIENFYFSFSIPKKDGSARLIHAPQGVLKNIQKNLHKPYIFTHKTITLTYHMDLKRIKILLAMQLSIEIKNMFLI